jgi:hypothetical protein
LQVPTCAKLFRHRSTTCDTPPAARCEWSRALQPAPGSHTLPCGLAQDPQCPACGALRARQGQLVSGGAKMVSGGPKRWYHVLANILRWRQGSACMPVAASIASAQPLPKTTNPLSGHRAHMLDGAAPHHRPLPRRPTVWRLIAAGSCAAAVGTLTGQRITGPALPHSTAQHSTHEFPPCCVVNISSRCSPQHITHGHMVVVVPKAYRMFGCLCMP